MADTSGLLKGVSISKATVCKSCDRILTSVSTEGDLVISDSGVEACDTCRPLEELHSVMQEKDAAFRELEDRRFEHGGRLHALNEVKAAHKAFDNFLLQVEAHAATIPVEKEDSASNEGEAEEATGPPSPKHSKKRPLTPATAPRSLKRPHLNDNTRRVSFDSAVIFKPENETRAELSFNRNSQTYIPGKNAPREGAEYWDTSGVGTTPTKFFGLKKKGKGWIETKEGKELDELWRSGSGEEHEETAAVEVPDSQNTEPSATGDGLAANETKFKSEEAEKSKEEGTPSHPIVSSTNEEAEIGDEAIQTQSSEANTSSDSTAKCQTQGRLKGAIQETSQGSGEATEHKSEPFVPETPKTCQDATKQGVASKQTAGSSQADGAFTYGMGWSDKVSPRSQPRGETWKANKLESLSKDEEKEQSRRGRHGRK